MATLHGSWIWYELMTADPARAKAFYEAVGAWSLSPGSAQTGDYGFITAADGAMIGGILALNEAMIAGGARAGWIGYIGVADADASAASIAAAGGRLLMPARDVPMAGRVAMVADAGGAPFYIMTPTPPPGGGESTAFTALPNPGHCGWNELMAGDAGRETTFYTNQFGWTLPEPMDMGDLGKYQFVAHDGVTQGAIMGLMPGAPVPMWNHYFWVASIDAAKSAIESNEGTVINGPMEVPGGNWIVQGLDPEGAVFSLVGAR